MIIAKTKKDLDQVLDVFRKSGNKIGFVPTMGALHEGHRSLIKRSVSENDRTVCSIFVNPTQFTDSNDLLRYPRPVNKDIQILSDEGTDVLFMPEVNEMYPVKEKWHLDLGNLDTILEGSSRPGHFQGVTQVVSKFFEMVKPAQAYFGQKDYQQFAVISQMVRKLKYSVNLVRCPIIREDDGLAMSSRNVHLDAEERKDARLISRSLLLAQKLSLNQPVFEVCRQAIELIQLGSKLKLDYFSIVNATTLQQISKWEESENSIALTAVWAGKTRLIDNLFLGN